MSDFPQATGNCTANSPALAAEANACQERLLYAKEFQDEGPYGSWAEIFFTVSKCGQAHFTLPREFARIEQATVCHRPIPVNNQFFEYLRFGNGRMPRFPSGLRAPHSDFLTQAYMRNNVPLFTDLTNAPQYIQVFISNPLDAGKRTLIQGTDNTGTVIYSQDVLNNVQGEFLTFAQPFVQTPQTLNMITGIQKDQTLGQVQYFQVDPNTGASVLLLTMEPIETVASYRRYYFHPLPINCCGFNPPGATTPVTTVGVTALAKLELIPVQVDTDYLLIQSIEAMCLEARSRRMSKNDSAEAQAQSAAYHTQAIRLLLGQLTHYQGLTEPAIQFRPFGSARLSRQKVGSLI